MSDIILSTTDFIPNRDIIEILGIARGSTVRARNIVGGEIEEYK